jgi:hypothetical protein
VRHHPANAVGAGEHRRRFPHVSLGDELAHAAAGDVFASQFQRLHDFQLQPRGAAQRAEEVDVSRTPPAEVKVGTLHQGPGVERMPHDALEELLGRKPQERFLGGIGDHLVHPQLGQKLRLAFGPGQGRRAKVRPQDSHRVRVEREHHRRPTHALRLSDKPLHDPRMPTVHAVEVPDRDRPAPVLGGYLIQTAKKFQGGQNSGGTSASDARNISDYRGAPTSRQWAQRQVRAASPNPGPITPAPGGIRRRRVCWKWRCPRGRRRRHRPVQTECRHRWRGRSGG